jgi:hypothetical protein
MKLTEAQTDHAVTKDLILKLSEDVGATIRRTLSIAPEPHLPVAMAAGASAVAAIAVLLNDDPKSEPDRDCLLLAGLLLAHIGPDAVKNAYRDFEVLKAAGRSALQREGE